MFFLSFFGKAGDWLDAEFSKQLFLGVYDFVEGDRQTVVRRGAMSLDTDDLVAQQQIDRAAFNAGQAKFGLQKWRPKSASKPKRSGHPLTNPWQLIGCGVKCLPTTKNVSTRSCWETPFSRWRMGEFTGDAHVFQAPVEGPAMGCPKAGLSGYDSV